MGSPEETGSERAAGCLDVQRRGAIAIATLNRPASFNALDRLLIDALGRFFAELHDDPACRVVLLRAAGPHFCAGLDLADWNDRLAAFGVRESLAMQTRIGQIVRLMRSCPQPVIALAHGAASGGGFSLMLASDVRVGTPDLRMNAAYIRVGLGGCDIGSSYFLPRLVGASVASELLLTGRFIGAERALRVGLLSDVVAPDRLLDAGLELAGEMLTTAPMGLRLTKEVLNLNIDAPGIEAAMAMEDRQQVMLTATRDHREAVSAFLEKRTPSFHDC